MTKASHLDIENRADDAEEYADLCKALGEEEQALDGMVDWLAEQEADAEFQAELAEHMSREEGQELLIVCAWCNEVKGTKPGDGTSGVTHTICPECKERMTGRAA